MVWPKEERSGMGCLALAVLGLLLAAAATSCGPSSGAAGDAGPAEDAGEPAADAAPACPEPVTSCEVRFELARPPGASSAELRGSFRAGGWELGEPMSLAGDTFSATLELEHRSLVEYKFVVDGGTWILDPGNPSTLPDESGNLNSALEVDCGCDEGAFDWRDAVLYFVFLDRFANGDPDNDAPLDGVAEAANYQGGDLAGLLATIESGYFDELGVNVLWITSPIDNADGIGLGIDGRSYSAYHGYWPRDLEILEARAGTEAELRAVVDAAHARGIRVLVDYVMNHVHAESPLYADHPDWFWPNDNGAGGNCVCGDGCGWDGDDGRRCWFTGYLPDFDFRHPDARAWSIDNALRWIERTGIDGFRLDAIKHVELGWVVDLRRRLREEVEAVTGETFYLVGETFVGDRATIGAYVDPVSKLDGQFDFPLRAEIARVVLRRTGSMNELALFLGENDEAYHPDAVMSTFVGNHDLPRPIHLAEDTPLFGDWDSGQGRAWDDRPEQPAGAAPYERLGVAFALLFTSPGVPLLYYGDELGLAGAGDPDNRRPMPWTGWTAPQQALRDHIARLAAVRHASPALRRGARTILGATAEVLVYEMRSAGQTLVVALNRSDEVREVPSVPAGDYRELLADTDVTAPLTIPPRSALILERR